ncbi:MAG TPA: response regulator [Verrucomicrobiae bacterium]|nr:response regulator [Verrucomicrobiae bacterium]
MVALKTHHHPRQVLFVDDEQDFLRVVRDSLAPLCDGQWEIHCASTTDAALETLKQRKIDLAVVDTNMPVLDGVQFLKLLGKRHPDLKKVSLTAFVTEGNRSACLAAGAELFIEKPRSPDGFKSVFAMLDDLMNWAPQEGFRGMLRRVGLQDVIQMECLGRNSSVLEVYNDHVFGRIYIENGSIIHAAGGDLTGERALQRLLALPGGSFELVPFEPPPQITINGPWEFLLMEAARVRDEMASQIASEPEVDPKTLAAPEAPAVQVLETVICSGAGQLLYEADCADAQGRVALLKNIGRQAAQFAQIVPLGNFDRLEMEFPDGRAIAQVRHNRMVFVRVANEPSGT